MVSFSFSKIKLPKADMKIAKPKFSAWVDYSIYKPTTESLRESDGKKDLPNELDYSPLRRVTMESFLMGILISMGGFV